MAGREKKMRTKQAASKRFTLSEKRKIIKAFQDGDRSKQAVWQEYTGEMTEKGQIVRWMRQLGYLDQNKAAASPNLFMIKKHKAPQPPDIQISDTTGFTKVQVLQQQLKDSMLREQAYILMIEIAERDLKVSIRKKLPTK
jgi:hypothetical protein